MLKDADDFKLWIIQRLEEIECKGDVISIAIYAVAILEKAKNDVNIKQSCVSHLREFLGKDTEIFVNDLLEIYKNIDFNYEDTHHRVQSSIEAIEHSPRKSPVRSKGRRSFVPPRRDRSSSTGSGSSVGERRTNNKYDSVENKGDSKQMPIDSGDGTRQGNYFNRKGPRPVTRHSGIDPLVANAMKKVFENNSHQNRPQYRQFNSKRPINAQRNFQKSPPNSLLITNLPRHNNTISFLNEHFGIFGNIENIQVNYNGKPDSAVISFSTAEDVQNAIKSSNSVFGDESVSVTLLRESTMGIKRKRSFTSTSFPPRSKLSLNNVARRKTDFVIAKLSEKNENQERKACKDDKLKKLNELFLLKSDLLSQAEKNLKYLNEFEQNGKVPSDSERVELQQMKESLDANIATLNEEIDAINKKKADLIPSSTPTEEMSPLKLKALLLSVELSLLSKKCPSRTNLVRKRQQILNKLELTDNSFESTVGKLMLRALHTTTNERFEVDKRCKTLSVKMSIPIDPNQLAGVLKDRLFAEAVDVVDSNRVNAHFSSHSKADKVRGIINCFTSQPLIVEWADQGIFVENVVVEVATTNDC